MLNILQKKIIYNLQHTDGQRQHKPTSHKTVTQRRCQRLTTTTISLFVLLLVFSNLQLIQSQRTYYHDAYSEERTPHYSGYYHLNENNRNMIETERQCKNYLCKYGYLDCNCTSYLLPIQTRYKRQIFAQGQVLVPTELEQVNTYEPNPDVTFPPILTTPSSQACRPAHFRRGYEEFQIIYRLNVTGHCDRVTKAFMSKSRCGQPDMFDIDDMTGHDSEEYYHEYHHYSKQPATSRSSSSSSSSSDSSEERYYPRNRRSVSLKELILEPSLDSNKLSSTRMKQLQQTISMQPDNHVTYNNGKSSRTKRSSFTFRFDPIGKLNKAVITWRLMSAHTNPSIDVAEQNGNLAHAFRYWSEVTPICFKEDKTSSHVDIEIGFLAGTHLNCYKQFDGFGGEIAHKFYRDVHFDKTDPYTASPSPSRSTDISLLLVAVHEIGHVLGLNHSAIDQSVMNAIYHRNIRGNFELSTHDRSEIKRLYGACGGSFDIVMDYVRNSGSTRIFNTFFFRKDNVWRYENKNRRTRYGDPKIISDNNWNGLPANLDTYVHYFKKSTSGQNGVSERYYFFKGSNYYQYDPNLDRVSQTGRISAVFSRGRNGAIPNNLDAAFYEYTTELIFFFKGSRVYKYNFSMTGSHSCCTERPTSIVNLFPPATPNDLYAPSGVSYQNNIDSVYLSWASPYRLYLIKGEEVWHVENYSIFGPYNDANFRVKYLGKWNTIWHYICEVDCPA